MSQFVLQLFCRKSSFDSLAILVKDGISTRLAGFSGFRAGVHPHKADKTHDEKHRPKPAEYKPRPDY